MIKVDDKGGMATKMGQLPPGGEIEFSGPFGELDLNIDIPREVAPPNGWLPKFSSFSFRHIMLYSCSFETLTFPAIRRIGMIAGGAGISPMIQVSLSFCLISTSTKHLKQNKVI